MPVAPALLAALLAHAAAPLLVPHSKVEESFALQAAHDALVHGLRRPQHWDHAVFAGAVPRSFAPPLLLAGAVALPVRAAGLGGEGAQAAVRVTLAVLYVLSLVPLQRALAPGRSPRARQTRAWALLLHAVSFAGVFWAGRTTPGNVVAPAVNLALASLLSPRPAMWALVLLASLAAIARAELAGLVLPLLPHLLVTLGLRRFLLAAALSVLLLSASVALDTHLWQRPFTLARGGLLWAEAEAALFNVVDGHASDWGVLPAHAYATRFLPRLLSGALLALPFGIVSLLATPREETAAGSSARRALGVATAHVALMSALPHKEARFVAHTLPLWLHIAARGLVTLMHGPLPLPQALSSRALVRLAARLGAGVVLLLCVLHLGVGHAASAANYPGGEALHWLQEHAPAGPVHLHIEPAAAQSGVTLFTSRFLPRPAGAWLAAPPRQWTYDKREDAAPDDEAYWRRVTHRLADSPCAGLAAPDAGVRWRDMRPPATDFAGWRRTGWRLEPRRHARVWVCEHADGKH